MNISLSESQLTFLNVMMTNYYKVGLILNSAWQNFVDRQIKPEHIL